MIVARQSIFLYPPEILPYMFLPYMILLSFTSVEFYVIAFIIAAAIIALCIKPASRGEAETIFVKGVLSSAESTPPSIQIKVNPDNTVTITRRGLTDTTHQSAVTLAITKIGFDLQINERIAPMPGEPANEASFIIDFLAPERYHIKYQAEPAELFAAFTLPVKPGISIEKNLIR